MWLIGNLNDFRESGFRAEAVELWCLRAVWAVRLARSGRRFGCLSPAVGPPAVMVPQALSPVGLAFQ